MATPLWALNPSHSRARAKKSVWCEVVEALALGVFGWNECWFGLCGFDAALGVLEGLAGVPAHRLSLIVY